MTSLITGATGFIGRNLLRALARRGEEIIAVSRRPQNDEADKLVSWMEMPKDISAWAAAIEQVSTIYHFAWSSLPQQSNEDPVGDASDNIVGTLRLLEAAKQKKDLRFVFPSSGGTVYGILTSVPANERHDTRPRCAYGVSKLTVEKYLTLYRDLWQLDYAALRIANAYGPGQNVGRNFGAVSTFALRAAKGDPITILGDGSVVRDYVYIDDLIEAVIAAGKHRGGATVMNIGSGTGKSLNDIVTTLEAICGRDIKVNYVPGRTFDVPVSVLDVSLAQAELGWRPRTTFEEGVTATLKGFRGT